MKIIISMTDKKPLYEQIKTQIRKQILTKELQAKTKLPSIRNLAHILRVGVITVKRAYDDLVNEGYLISIEAKGYYVNNLVYEKLLKTALVDLKEMLRTLKKEADLYDINEDQLKEMLEEVYNE